MEAIAIEAVHPSKATTQLFPFSCPLPAAHQASHRTGQPCSCCFAHIHVMNHCQGDPDKHKTCGFTAGIEASSSWPLISQPTKVVPAIQFSTSSQLSTSSFFQWRPTQQLSSLSGGKTGNPRKLDAWQEWILTEHIASYNTSPFFLVLQFSPKTDANAKQKEDALISDRKNDAGGQNDRLRKEGK